MESIIQSLTTAVMGLSAGLALLALMWCVIANMFFKQDFRAALSKLGSVFGGCFIMGGGAALVRGAMELGKMLS